MTCESNIDGKNIFYIFLVIAIILFLIYYLKKQYLKEDFQGQLVRDADKFDQEVFTDMSTYYNLQDIDDNGNIIVEPGIETCLKNCDGNCLEFDVSGLAFCFPPKKKVYKPEYLCDDRCLNTDRLSFPNLFRK
ncbi:MAG: hypothetical protein Edafosvirus18_8 [Edafosvirus sp.]|uniref:Uncharacterized protein n=1 Tax=Edafosvirus sp. TaxID=2487765 RepID=A0A3G4ZYS1_9VIRU|nr:MAG: hypothetical protein Edafosvirus18_8 [Edafosvirus sp.]